MKYSALLLILVALAASPSRSHAEVRDYATLPNSPAYEAAAQPLRDAPPSEFTFSQARLTDVLQFLASEAGISFFSLPDDSEAANRIVTFTIHSSPFLALETLAKANGIALIYENGVWYLRPENDTYLIGRVYHIQYNPHEKVTSQSNGGGLGSIGGGGFGGGSTSGSFGGGGGGGINLQGNTQSFEVEPSQLVDDIKELLNIPTTAAILAPSASVDSLGAGQGTANTIILPSAGVAGAYPGDEEAANQARGAAKVIWSSDSNALYVVATRQQHQWIEGYLAAADKPKDQIAIEVKFFETSRDPMREFGVDWSGTLAGGYDIDLRGGGGDDEDGESDGLSSVLNLNRIGDYALPATAILSYQDLNVKLRSLVNDSNTKTVSYPRMVTSNNREVMIRSVINQPVLDATSSSTVGAGATTTQSVTYLPIGTVLNILPKRLGNGKIQLNIALTVSSIIGTQVIDGNPFPIASSRVYNAPVEIDSGYTVAIGGLDEANVDEQEVGIPVLRKIPVLSYAFKYKKQQRTRKSLMIFITPRVLDTTNGGLPDEPQSVVRTTPHDPAPPRIYEDGSLVQHPEQLPGAITSLERELEILEQIVYEGRSERKHQVQADALDASISRTLEKLNAFAAENPQMWEEHYSQYQWRLLQLQNRINILREEMSEDVY